MKKLLITILVFLFTATAICYAGIFKQSENESTDTNGSVYDKTAVSTEKEESTDDYGGFFKAPADVPGGRPGSGGGIGQRSPVGNGLFLLVICSMFLTAGKYYSQQKKEKREN